MDKTAKIKLYFFGIILFLVWTPLAFAIEYEALGGRPAVPQPGVENSASWFIYQLEPGQQKQDEVLVMNLYAEPMQAVIYAADSSPSSSGGFALKQLNDQQDKVGTWVKFYPNDPPERFAELFAQKGRDILYLCNSQRDQLTQEFGEQPIDESDWGQLNKWCEGETLINREMQAKEEYQLPFVFSVPDNADVGEHTGGIMIQKGLVEDAAQMEGSGVRLTTRVGVRIYETVPGEVTKRITLEDFKVIKNFKEFDFANWFSKDKKPEEYLIQSKVRNEGNASANHKNNIIVKGLLFNRRSEYIEREFQVLRDDSFIANYAWRNPRFGYFSFQGEVKYQDENGAEQVLRSETKKLLVMPWREIVISLFVISMILFAMIIFRWRWQKKYSGRGWKRYVVRSGDNIGSLSERCNTDWKTLARTNRIKKPYHLNPGQSILVPSRGNFIRQAHGKIPQSANKKYQFEYKGLILRLVILCLIAIMAVAIVFVVRSNAQSRNDVIKNTIDISSPR